MLTALHRSLLLTLTLFFGLAASVHAAPQGEHIIVSGGPALMEWEKYKNPPHDRWWGNFIRAARHRIQEIQAEYGPDARITWLVYRPGYVRRAERQDKRDLIGFIESVRDKYNVRLIWFNKTSQVIDYLNHGLPRNEWKIATLDWFLHSNQVCFMFDYSNEIDSASKVWLHENELHQIRRGIFARNAIVKSWGCHTGESMSQKWRRVTGVPMIGAIGKTDYSQGYPPKINRGRWTR